MPTILSISLLCNIIFKEKGRANIVKNFVNGVLRVIMPSPQ